MYIVTTKLKHTLKYILKTNDRLKEICHRVQVWRIE